MTDSTRLLVPRACAVLVAVALMGCLGGCGKKGEGDEDEDQAKDENATTTTTTAGSVGADASMGSSEGSSSTTEASGSTSTESASTSTEESASMGTSLDGSDVPDVAIKPGDVRTLVAGQYLGCFDATNHPFLDGWRDIDENNTPSSCWHKCAEKGFRFAGVQETGCLCGNDYGIQGMLVESSCGYACAGDTSQKCGGFRASGVWAAVDGPDVQR